MQLTTNLFAEEITIKALKLWHWNAILLKMFCIVQSSNSFLIIAKMSLFPQCCFIKSFWDYCLPWETSTNSCKCDFVSMDFLSKWAFRSLRAAFSFKFSPWHGCNDVADACSVASYIVGVLIVIGALFCILNCSEKIRKIWKFMCIVHPFFDALKVGLASALALLAL